MPKIVDPAAPRLLDQLRSQIRYLHYSIRTEEAYVHWVRAFVRFHGLRHGESIESPKSSDGECQKPASATKNRKVHESSPRENVSVYIDSLSRAKQRGCCSRLMNHIQLHLVAA